MSLNFELGGIDNWRELCYNGDQLTDEATLMVFATMAVGIGRITEKNYVEFAIRCNVAGALIEFQSTADAYLKVTPEMVKKYVGLRTNVSDETQAKWFKRQMEGALMSAKWVESRRLQKLEV